MLSETEIIDEFFEQQNVLKELSKKQVTISKDRSHLANECDYRKDDHEQK